MPGGSTAQKLDNDSQQEMGNSLAADKARSLANLRATPTNDNDTLTATNDNNQNTTKPANENTAPLAANDGSYNPYTEEPKNDNNVPEEDTQLPPDEQEGSPENTTGVADMRAAEQAQLDAFQQAEVAMAMANGKQRALRQIQRKIDKLEKKLKELEGDLTKFKKSALGGLLKLFQPRLNLLIDTLISEMKRKIKNLPDEAKFRYYTFLIDTVTSIIKILTAFKFLAAFLDAAFIHKASCLRLVITTLATVIIPIILILLSPIYITFLALIFIMGKIPLMKGVFTQNIVKLIEDLKKQRKEWEEELDKVKKKVALRRQIKNLKGAQKQIKRSK